MITQSELKELLFYNPYTGVFIWNDNKSAKTHHEKIINSRIKGKIAGYTTTNGYIYISVRCRRYPSHVLAMIYMGVDLNNKHIDHIDHNRKNNRFSNLRLVTRSENMRNQKLRSDNSSGTVGVNWFKRISKWRAYITIDGKHIGLGYFYEKEDAIECRKKAEIKYGFHENHGK